MKHNPQGLAKKALVTGAVLGAAWYLLSRRDRDEDDRHHGYHRERHYRR